MHLWPSLMWFTSWNINTPFTLVLNAVVLSDGHLISVVIEACDIFTFTFMHLADAFIQSDLQCIQDILFFFFYQYVCSLGIEPTTFCAANAMLYHWATETHIWHQIQCKYWLSTRSLSLSLSLSTIFCTGSVGKNLANKPNVYVSSSAGVRWREVRTCISVQFKKKTVILVKIGFA